MPVERRKRLVSSKRHRPHSRKSRHYRDVPEEPFYLTNIKVGSALLLLCSTCYLIQWLFWSPNPKALDHISEDTWRSYVGNDGSNGIDNFSMNQKEEELQLQLPTFSMKDGTGPSMDVWDIATGMKALLSTTTTTTTTDHHHLPSDLNDFLQRSEQLRMEFSDLYGGTNASRALLRRGMKTILPSSSLLLQEKDPNDLDGSIHYQNQNEFLERIKESGVFYTAQMIFEAREQQTPVRVSFAGSSAVTGRGNFEKDAFPNKVNSLLSIPMKLLGVTMEVTNAAINDISSFPYGWCLSNHLGKHANVVSWDAAMNGRRDKSAGVESYLRNILSSSQNSFSPMFIVRENFISNERQKLIQTYVDDGILHDSIILNIEEAFKPYKQIDESILPKGFQNWESSYSAPSGALKKSRTYLTVKQQDLMGWMISLHLNEAMLIVAIHLLLVHNGRDGLFQPQNDFEKIKYLPEPNAILDSLKGKSNLALSMMAGTNSTTSTKWNFNPIHCRTSYDPVQFGGAMEDIIVGGITGEDLDLKLPRGPMLYNKAWVVDLDSQEKRNYKINEQYKLGYKDVKKAYFGVPASGSLKMFLPLDTTSDITKNKSLAQQIYKTLIICEIKQMKIHESCDMERDIEVVMGGQKTDKINYLDAEGTSYLGQKLCANVEIPETATITSKQQYLHEIENDTYLRPSNENRNENQTGISLEIKVIGDVVTWKTGPCTLSHIIWELQNNS